MGKSRVLYRMGMIKDRNSEDLTEAEEIKKRWQEYTEELYRKALIDPDNHNGVVDHLESDILKCEVNWDFGSIIMNKASGNDVIPAELFKILKKMLLKCCAQYVSKFRKVTSGNRIRKAQFSFQSKRRVMPKNVPATIQLQLPYNCTHFTYKQVK